MSFVAILMGSDSDWPVMQHAVAAELDLGDLDGIGSEDLRFRPHLGAGLAGGGGEHRDEPFGLRAGEVGAVELFGGHRGSFAMRGVREPHTGPVGGQSTGPTRPE